jgi:hypothetical protein
MKPGTGDNGGAGLMLGKRKRKHTPSFGFDQQQHQRRENLLSTADSHSFLHGTTVLFTCIRWRTNPQCHLAMAKRSQ